MPAGERLWRTEEGDLVPEGHPDAVVLAYGTDDVLKDADTDKVRSAEPDLVEGVLVVSDTAGSGAAENADTGAVTEPGDPLPVIEETEGDPLEKVEPEPEPEKPAESVTPKRTRSARQK